MKYFAYALSTAALLAVTGPAVAEEATGTSPSAASSLLMTLRADVKDVHAKTRDVFPAPKEFTLLGSIAIEPNQNGVFSSSSINNGQLDTVFKKIVHLHWEGGVEIPQDGTFILTMLGYEKCANEYRIGGELLFPKTKKRKGWSRWEQSVTVEGMSKGDFLEIDFTDFCRPAKRWKDLEKHTWALEAFFLKSGESVRLKNFKPKGSPT